MMKCMRQMHVANACCHLHEIQAVHLSMKTHFGNPASLTYQLHPSKLIFLSLLRDTEKVDEP